MVCEAGHQVVFYPKFHCDLNYIENYWAAVKWYTRENCSCPFQELGSTVLTLGSVSVKSFCRFTMRIKCWVMTYINGLTEEQRECAKKHIVEQLNVYLMNIYNVCMYILVSIFFAC